MNDQSWEAQTERAEQALRRELPRRQWERHQTVREVTIRSGGRVWHLDTECETSNCSVETRDEYGSTHHRTCCFGPFNTEQPHADFILAQYLLIKYMPDLAWDLAEDG